MKTIKFKENQEVRKGIIFLVFALLCNLGVSAQRIFTYQSFYCKTTSSSTVSVSSYIKGYYPEKKLVIPETVLYLSKIQYSVTGIIEQGFACCSTMTSATIPNSVTSIGEKAFTQCIDLTSVTIGNSVTSIGASAFYNCPSLYSVKISNPNSVTSIGASAFSRCEKLTSITLGNSLKRIEYGTFSSCIKLKSITIPDSVTSIGAYAFNNCKGLTSINIPNSVTSIGENAFGYCTGLTDIYCHIEEPLTITANVFNNVPKKTCTLHVPIGSKSKYEVADVWKDFLNIVEDVPTGIVSIDNSQLTIDNDVWHTLNGTRLNGKPTKAGVYIVNGKTVVIK